MALPHPFAGQRGWRFALLIGNGAAQALILLTIALITREVFAISGDPDVDTRSALTPLAVFLALAILASGILRWRGHVDAEILGQDYVHAVRRQLFNHVLALGGEGRRISEGETALRFLGDLTALRQWLTLGLARLAVAGVSSVLALVALAFLAPLVAAAVAFWIVVTLLAGAALEPGLRRATAESRRRRGSLAALTADRVAQAGVVEAFGRQQRELKRFMGRSANLRAALVRRGWLIGQLRALSESGAAVASLTALLVGVLEVGRGTITPGTVVACMLVAGLVAPRLQDCGRALEFWTAFKVARDRQLAFLSQQPKQKRDPRQPLASGPGHVELQGIRHKLLRHSVSVSIAGGSTVALIGPSGSGKTTIARLIAGLTRPKRGRVLLDGRPVDRLRRRDRARGIGLVSPDLSLLRGSIRENLLYGRSGTTDGEILSLAARLGLRDLLESLPQGLKTALAERASTLSAGERSRLCLMRALLARPRVLILDEVDAHLDRDAKHAVIEVIKDWSGTCIVITHDESFAHAVAGRIFRLQSRRLIEQSTSVRSPSKLSLVGRE